MISLSRRNRRSRLAWRNLRDARRGCASRGWCWRGRGRWPRRWVGVPSRRFRLHDGLATTNLEGNQDGGQKNDKTADSCDREFNRRHERRAARPRFQVEGLESGQGRRNGWPTSRGRERKPLHLPRGHPRAAFAAANGCVLEDLAGRSRSLQCVTCQRSIDLVVHANIPVVTHFRPFASTTCWISILVCQRPIVNARTLSKSWCSISERTSWALDRREAMTTLQREVSLGGDSLSGASVTRFNVCARSDVACRRPL
jgi:hypothetical protein